MKRDLGVVKLTILGIGSTIGAGIYVVLGIATKEVAGPSIVLSFLIAGIVTLLTSLCFAQYALRVQNGGLYQYVFKTYGQYSAFITVWAALIGAALMAAVSGQGISNCLDSLFNSTISNFTSTYIAYWPGTPLLTDHPNVFACAIVIAATIGVSKIEVNNFSAVINFLAVLNTSVLCIFMVLGGIYGRLENLTGFGSDSGGFFTFGFSGVLRGAALGFTAYGGFEFICMAAQEAKDPGRTVPRALVACVTSTTFINTGTAVAFTLLVPYWMIDTDSPLVGAVEYVHLHRASLVLFAGPVIGMLCSMVLGIYAVSRLLYSIAKQGLIDSRLAALSVNTKSPVAATIVTGIFVSFVTLLFKIDNLASLVTSGVLMIMTFVSFGTLHLFYGEEKRNENNDIIDNQYCKNEKSSEKDNCTNLKKLNPSKSIEESHQAVVVDCDSFVINPNFVDKNCSVYPVKSIDTVLNQYEQTDTKDTKSDNYYDNITMDFDKEFLQTKPGNCFTRITVSAYIVAIFVCCVFVSCLVTFYYDKLIAEDPLTLTLTTVGMVMMMSCCIIVAMYPVNESTKKHKLPLGPLIPVVSGFFNVLFFIGGLDPAGAVLFLVLLASGTVIWMVVCVMDFSREDDTSISTYTQIMRSDDVVTQKLGLSKIDDKFSQGDNDKLNHVTTRKLSSSKVVRFTDDIKQQTVFASADGANIDNGDAVTYVNTKILSQLDTFEFIDLEASNL